MGYIFDTKKGETPETIKRQRDIVRALLGAQRAPQNVGEGISALGDGIVANVLGGRADRAEAAGLESANAAMGPLAAMFGGGAAAASSSAYSGLPDGPKGQEAYGSPDIKSGIIETAKALGIDPADLGTAISYETAGTFDPKKAGPHTQWGQHRGLIQFGEPQAKQFGVNWDDPIGSQLGPDGAVAKYLRNAGVKPGMGMLDLYSAINAGGVGPEYYGRSDANNGGAPGTVRDKVEQQMAGHRQKALALLGADAGGGAQDALAAMAQQPVQTASLDPSAGVAQALGGGAQQPVAPDQIAQLLAQTPMGGGVGAGEFPAAPGAQAAPAPQQVAQALSQAPMGGGQAGGAFPAAPGSGEGKIQQLLAAAQNPYLSESQQAIVKALLGEEMQKRDPAYKMGLEKSQLELDALKHPKGDPFTLSEGQVRYDAKGNKIAAGGEKPEAKPSAVQEYEYAKGQGFTGTFQDWEASKKGGMSLQVDPATGAVTFQQGSNIKPMTEAQSKDTYFATKAAGSLPNIDKYGDALANFGENAAANTPLVGNYMKSDEYQQAEQAGGEFLAAILRKESGAAVPETEREQYGKVYLPRPGDGAPVLAQKKEARQRALDALKAGMTPQAILAQEQAISKGKPAEAAPAAEPGDLKDMPAPEGVDPAWWKFVPPEDRKLWK